MLSDFEVAGPALHCDWRGPMVQRARGVLGRVFGRAPVFDWMGGSIPIVSDLVREVGGEALLIGTGLDENNIHAPIEFFTLEQFKQGYLYAGLMLQAIAD